MGQQQWRRRIRGKPGRRFWCASPLVALRLGVMSTWCWGVSRRVYGGCTTWRRLGVRAVCSKEVRGDRGLAGSTYLSSSGFDADVEAKPCLTITPLTKFGFGAEVGGLDPLKPLAGSVAAQLARAFEEHSVLVLRRARLGDRDLVAFTRGFADAFPGASIEGSLGPAGTPRSRRSRGVGSLSSLLGKIANFDPETGEMLKRDSKLLQFRSGNGFWHIDSSFKVIPALASLLYGHMVPPPGTGGETEFVSSRLAFAALPGCQQDSLRELVSVHDFSYSISLACLGSSRGSWHKWLPPARHFLVRETKMGPALYVGKHCSHVEHLGVSEGRNLVRRLNRHVTRSPFVYRHCWMPGDLVICDNRSCLHRGRPWKNAHRVKRMVCLSKIAEPGNDVASSRTGERAIADAVPPPSAAEAEEMLRAVGLDDLDHSCCDGVVYCKP